MSIGEEKKHVLLVFEIRTSLSFYFAVAATGRVSAIKPTQKLPGSGGQLLLGNRDPIGGGVLGTLDHSRRCKGTRSLASSIRRSPARGSPLYKQGVPPFFNVLSVRTSDALFPHPSPLCPLSMDLLKTVTTALSPLGMGSNAIQDTLVRNFYFSYFL